MIRRYQNTKNFTILTKNLTSVSGSSYFRQTSILAFDIIRRCRLSVTASTRPIIAG